MNDKLLGMLGLAVRAGKVSFGVFMTEKLVEEGKARLVIAASDIGASNKRRLEAKCSHAGVRIIYYSNKENLSRAVGRENTPAVGIKDEGFTEAIVKIFGGVAK